MAACAGAGVSDGSHCETDVIPSGTCTNGVCISSGCGNGIVDQGEVCDDGNTVSGDGCSADCLSIETCGNKITDASKGEQCDCGVAGDVAPGCTGPNSDTAGVCNTMCKLRCGDGIVEADEGCDPGAPSSVVSCAGAVYDRGLTTCSPSCQPVIAPDTCKYIGWRTRGTQAPATIVAPTSAGNGFFVAGPAVGSYTSYVGTSTLNAGVTLNDVWAADNLTAVAVGDGGKILRLDGSTWDVQSSGTSVDLLAVWGRSSDDIYAVGDSTVVHWDGASWLLLEMPGVFRAVSGDASHVYVAGDHGTLLVYDGVTWQPAAVGTIEDLRGVSSSGSLVVAVGANGTIVQDDGTGWVVGRTSSTANLLSTWGSASDGFFAVGEAGTVLFYDGSVWRPLALGHGVTGPPNQTYSEVRGLPGVEIGIRGTVDVATYDGAAWSPVAVPTAETIYGLWGSAPDDVFAVGRNGTILHHDGLTWTVQPTPTTADLRAVSGIGPHDVYAAGDGSTLLHYDGVAWTPVVAAEGIENYTAVYAAGVDDVYVAGAGGVYHYTGAIAPSLPTAAAILWGTSPTDIFAAGTGIEAFDGSSWSPTSVATNVRGLSGTSATDVYAVGPSAFHYNGAEWSSGPFTDADLTCVAASAVGVFAAGNSGKLRHWNGTALEPFVSRTTTDLNALFVIGNDVFMAGNDGTLDIMVFTK